MDAEWKRKWVEVLRSGKYKQGLGRLRTVDNCYCCLGVLCDLIDPTGWEGYGDYKWRESKDDVPEKTADEISLGSQHCLIEMNDGGLPFAAIADWIEEKL